ncbi:prepilin-type N-terminal cleavage/methylation domain-containing protein [Opitutaceae bacterium TAV1]|nr:prepilin-type N-terminal cleavage/methylation domain-containing protein [Opitutaceae bacterium TAV1]
MNSPKNSPAVLISGNRSAFTLVELLTVIAIIGILAAIIIPTVGKVRQSARRTRSISNLKSIVQGIHLYMQDNKQTLPPKEYTKDGGGMAYWPVKLEDYVGKRVKIQVKPNETADISPVFIDPVRTLHHGISDYGLNDYFCPTDKNTPYSNIKNPSQVILVASVLEGNASDQGSWRIYTYGAAYGSYETETGRLDDYGMSGGYPVAYADGHTALLKKEVYREQAARKRLLREE